MGRLRNHVQTRITAPRTPRAAEGSLDTPEALRNPAFVYSKKIMAPNSTDANTGSIVSLLDTDLLKLSMQCAVLRYFPHVQVVYALGNRTPEMKLSRAAFEWLRAQIDST